MNMTIVFKVSDNIKQKMIDYYFVYGQSMDSIVSGYRTLTGRAPILPKWAWGFWQSRERYKTQNEIVGTLKQFRDKHIPIDNIVLDWSYWEEDQWGAFTFDPARFADPKKMVDDIHAMHSHIMISHWPKYYINILKNIIQNIGIKLSVKTLKNLKKKKEKDYLSN